MEDITPPSPVEVRPKTVAEQLIERIVAWVVLGGFGLGILGAVFGLFVLLFLDWEDLQIWLLHPVFYWFLVGTILGAVIGLLVGIIGGGIRYWLVGIPSDCGEHSPPASQNHS
jgi:hypothetical protein